MIMMLIVMMMFTMTVIMLMPRHKGVEAPELRGRQAKLGRQRSVGALSLVSAPRKTHQQRRQGATMCNTLAASWHRRKCASSLLREGALPTHGHYKLGRSWRAPPRRLRTILPATPKLLAPGRFPKLTAILHLDFGCRALAA